MLALAPRADEFARVADGPTSPRLGLAPILRDSVYDMLNKIVERGIAMLAGRRESEPICTVWLTGFTCSKVGRIAVEGDAGDILEDRAALLQAYVG